MNCAETMETFLDGKVALHAGDCRDVLKTLPDNSIDSVVTDPPYHLTSIVKRFGGKNAAPAKYGTDGAFARASRGFMCTTWDGGDIAFQPATWAEVLRVLKPGGYCAAFGAPRNFGRLQVAMFEAGFEERDTILNNLDTESPIAMFLESLNDAQRDAFMKCLQQSDIAGMLAWKFGVGFPKSHNVGRGIDAQILRESGIELGPEDDIPNTPEGDLWRDFGTSLKPAFEPIVLARKPLSEKTVAANVLRWGTGALNIGACRVASPGESIAAHHGTGGGAGHTTGAWNENYQKGDSGKLVQALGRWPANVVTDGSDQVVEAFPNTSSVGHDPRKSKGNPFGGTNDAERTERHWNDESKSAARFFYSAKASKADRAGSKHPTIKPISLMQWLARLITPPGGTVIDPFAGSGTTGAACALEGFNCVLIEREAEYLADIRRRLTNPIVDKTESKPEQPSSSVLTTYEKIETARILYPDLFAFADLGAAE